MDELTINFLDLNEPAKQSHRDRKKPEVLDNLEALLKVHPPISTTQRVERLAVFCSRTLTNYDKVCAVIERVADAIAPELIVTAQYC